jgi:HCOMODA/2-hydroxy-3-carboxy-muconic semialdehyde decarboxylase
VPDALATAKEELARANRIIANEGVLDAFGHVSMRHPTDPGRYLLSRSRGPELVEPDDILEFTLDSHPVVPPTKRLYSERVIHGCIYQARPDVTAICHHHSPSLLPFCISGMELQPVFHLGGTIGPKAPFWDQRDEFGDTNMLVIKPEEGESLARALGPYWIVLMRRHGATVAGTTLQELTFRTIYICRNAEAQLRAHGLGHVMALNAGEAEKARHHNLQPGPIGRAWEYWNIRLDKAERMTGTGTASRPTPAKRASAGGSKPKAPARRAAAARPTTPPSKRSRGRAASAKRKR